MGLTVGAAAGVCLLLFMILVAAAADPIKNGAHSPYGFAADASSVVGEMVSNFSCEGLEYGYYADQSHSCKVFHICMPNLTPSGRVRDAFMFSFFCPNHTRFSQDSRTCIAEEYAYPCRAAHLLYVLNDDIGDNTETDRVTPSRPNRINNIPKTIPARATVLSATQRPVILDDDIDDLDDDILDADDSFTLSPRRGTGGGTRSTQPAFLKTSGFPSTPEVFHEVDDILNDYDDFVLTTPLKPNLIGGRNTPVFGVARVQNSATTQKTTFAQQSPAQGTGLVTSTNERVGHISRTEENLSGAVSLQTTARRIDSSNKDVSISPKITQQGVTGQRTQGLPQKVVSQNTPNVSQGSNENVPRGRKVQGSISNSKNQVSINRRSQANITLVTEEETPIAGLQKTQQSPNDQFSPPGTTRGPQAFSAQKIMSLPQQISTDAIEGTSLNSQTNRRVEQTNQEQINQNQHKDHQKTSQGNESRPLPPLTSSGQPIPKPDFSKLKGNFQQIGLRIIKHDPIEKSDLRASGVGATVKPSSKPSATTPVDNGSVRGSQAFAAQNTGTLTQQRNVKKQESHFSNDQNNERGGQKDQNQTDHHNQAARRTDSGTFSQSTNFGRPIPEPDFSKLKGNFQQIGFKIIKHDPIKKSELRASGVGSALKPSATPVAATPVDKSNGRGSQAFTTQNIGSLSQQNDLKNEEANIPDEQTYIRGEQTNQNQNNNHQKTSQGNESRPFPPLTSSGQPIPKPDFSKLKGNFQQIGFKIIEHAPIKKSDLRGSGVQPTVKPRSKPTINSPPTGLNAPNLVPNIGTTSHIVVHDNQLIGKSPSEEDNIGKRTSQRGQNRRNNQNADVTLNDSNEGTSFNIPIPDLSNIGGNVRQIGFKVIKHNNKKSPDNTASTVSNSRSTSVPQIRSGASLYGADTSQDSGSQKDTTEDASRSQPPQSAVITSNLGRRGQVQRRVVQTVSGIRQPQQPSSSEGVIGNDDLPILTTGDRESQISGLNVDIDHHSSVDKLLPPPPEFQNTDGNLEQYSLAAKNQRNRGARISVTKKQITTPLAVSSANQNALDLLSSATPSYLPTTARIIQQENGQNIRIPGFSKGVIRRNGKIIEGTATPKAGQPSIQSQITQPSIETRTTRAPVTTSTVRRDKTTVPAVRLVSRRPIDKRTTLIESVQVGVTESYLPDPETESPATEVAPSNIRGNTRGNSRGRGRANHGRGNVVAANPNNAERGQRQNTASSSRNLRTGSNNNARSTPKKSGQSIQSRSRGHEVKTAQDLEILIDDDFDAATASLLAGIQPPRTIRNKKESASVEKNPDAVNIDLSSNRVTHNTADEVDFTGPDRPLPLNPFNPRKNTPANRRATPGSSHLGTVGSINTNNRNGEVHPDLLPTTTTTTTTSTTTTTTTTTPKPRTTRTPRPSTTPTTPRPVNDKRGHVKFQPSPFHDLSWLGASQRNQVNVLLNRVADYSSSRGQSRSSDNSRDKDADQGKAKNIENKNSFLVQPTPVPTQPMPAKIRTFQNTRRSFGSGVTQSSSLNTENLSEGVSSNQLDIENENINQEAEHSSAGVESGPNAFASESNSRRRVRNNLVKVRANRIAAPAPNEIEGSSATDGNKVLTQTKSTNLLPTTTASTEALTVEQRISITVTSSSTILPATKEDEIKIETTTPQLPSTTISPITTPTTPAPPTTTTPPTTKTPPSTPPTTTTEKYIIPETPTTVKPRLTTTPKFKPTLAKNELTEEEHPSLDVAPLISQQLSSASLDNLKNPQQISQPVTRGRTSRTRQNVRVTVQKTNVEENDISGVVESRPPLRERKTLKEITTESAAVTATKKATTTTTTTTSTTTTARPQASTTIDQPKTTEGSVWLEGDANNKHQVAPSNGDRASVDYPPLISTDDPTIASVETTTISLLNLFKNLQSTNASEIPNAGQITKGRKVVRVNRIPLNNKETVQLPTTPAGPVNLHFNLEGRNDKKKTRDDNMENAESLFEEGRSTNNRRTVAIKRVVPAKADVIATEFIVSTGILDSQPKVATEKQVLNEGNARLNTNSRRRGNHLVQKKETLNETKENQSNEIVALDGLSEGPQNGSSPGRLQRKFSSVRRTVKPVEIFAPSNHSEEIIANAPKKIVVSVLNNQQRTLTRQRNARQRHPADQTTSEITLTQEQVEGRTENSAVTESLIATEHTTTRSRFRGNTIDLKAQLPVKPEITQAGDSAIASESLPSGSQVNSSVNSTRRSFSKRLTNRRIIESPVTADNEIDTVPNAETTTAIAGLELKNNRALRLQPSPGRLNRNRNVQTTQSAVPEVTESSISTVSESTSETESGRVSKLKSGPRRLNLNRNVQTTQSAAPEVTESSISAVSESTSETESGRVLRLQTGPRRINLIRNVQTTQSTVPEVTDSSISNISESIPETESRLQTGPRRLNRNRNVQTTQTAVPEVTESSISSVSESISETESGRNIGIKTRFQTRLRGSLTQSEVTQATESPKTTKREIITGLSSSNDVTESSTQAPYQGVPESNSRNRFSGSRRTSKRLISKTNDTSGNEIIQEKKEITTSTTTEITTEGNQNVGNNARIAIFREPSRTNQDHISAAPVTTVSPQTIKREISKSTVPAIFANLFTKAPINFENVFETKFIMGDIGNEDEIQSISESQNTRRTALRRRLINSVQDSEDKSNANGEVNNVAGVDNLQQTEQQHVQATTEPVPVEGENPARRTVQNRKFVKKVKLVKDGVSDQSLNNVYQTLRSGSSNTTIKSHELNIPGLEPGIKLRVVGTSVKKSVSSTATSSTDKASSSSVPALELNTNTDNVDTGSVVKKVILRQHVKELSFGDEDLEGLQGEESAAIRTRIIRRKLAGSS